MTGTKAATLKVTGATLYYEVAGTGPTLLIIAGGPQDAGVFAGLARELGGRYTVVTYDPRGNSRSRFDGAVEPLDVDVQADDAAALIADIGNGPAHVFGTSGGAQIGLNLAARYPGSVATLIAHEAPTALLLTDSEGQIEELKTLTAIYEQDGVDAAMGAFFGMNDLEDALPEGDAGPEFEMGPEEAETFGRVSGNFEYWLKHGMTPLTLHLPDIAALRAGKPRIVVAVGEGSAGQPIEAMSEALAAALGVPPVVFPGDHMGFETQAAEFAAAIDRAIG